MKTSKFGIDVIKSFEGLRLKAYKAVPTEKYYTIGYGHYGADVKPTAVITEQQAVEYLKKDLEKFEKKVEKYNNIYNFNQDQFDALVSFAYNVGNIDQLTKKGQRSIDEISNSFELYVKSGGKVLEGLKRRRKVEKNLFDSGKSKYYNKYIGNSKMIDIVFKSIGVPDKYLGSYTNRKAVASANGIKNYTGSKNDNLKLIELAKQGKLRVV